MRISILPQKCVKGQWLPLRTEHQLFIRGHTLLCPHNVQEIVHMGVGAEFVNEAGETLFRLCGLMWTPAPATSLPVIESDRDIESRAEPIWLTINKNGYAAAIITLSDKSSQGLRQDESGPKIAEMISGALRLACIRNFLLPDDAPMLKALLADLALAQKYDLIITTGGTGLGPRDITPQATSSLLDLSLPGFTQAMLARSLEKTSRAIISRACCGVIGGALIINLPGSLKGASENLEAVLPALDHALQKLHGDTSDCGG